MQTESITFTANQREKKLIKLGSLLVTCTLYASIALLAYGKGEKIGLTPKLTSKIVTHLSLFHIRHIQHSRHKVAQANQKQAVARNLPTSAVVHKVEHSKKLKKAEIAKQETVRKVAEKQATTTEPAKLEQTSKVWSEKQFALAYPAAFQKMQLYLKMHKHYPALAKQRGIQGVVQLQVQVDKDGELQRAKLVKSSQYAILDNAAIKLVKDAFPLGKMERMITFTMQVSYNLQEN